MPELPDISVYREALERRVLGSVIERIRIRSPFVLRTYEPPIEAAERRAVGGVGRLGKRIVLSLDEELHLVMHLMIAGRLRWFDAGATPVKPSAIELASITFDSGVLVITEAGSKKRASLHLVRGAEPLRALHRGGVDVLACTPEEFTAVLRRENRTLKRALTNPAAFDGIGNAYSDEILHASRLSPILLTSKLTDEEAARLRGAAQRILVEWTDRLRREFGLDAPPSPGKFPGPGEITAFRPDFAVHGKFGMPCPICGHAVQRIVHAENETNYCAGCQTGGRVLADRSLSRLLKDGWPRTIEEWEA